MKKLRLSFDKESMKLHIAIDDYVDFYNPYTGNVTRKYFSDYDSDLPGFDMDLNEEDEIDIYLEENI